jgi:hypothetical protein
VWDKAGGTALPQVARSRNIILVLVGVSGLLIKRWLSTSLGEVAHCYLGNVSVSFSVYYLVSLAAGGRLNRAAYIVIALLAVQSFELADGFGIMSNVYDHYDLIANALGVAIAFVVDVVLDRMLLQP